MLHRIFALIFCGNIVEVATLIKNDPEAIRVKNSNWLSSTPLVYASSNGQAAQMPKTADISYNDEMEKIRGLILENEDSDGILSFDNLLEKLHVKKVHYK